MIEEELDYIERSFIRGIELLQDGKLRSVTKLTRRLNAQSTFAVSETQRAVAILNGYTLLTRHKVRRAKEYCLKSIMYLWDNPDGLYIIRQANPVVDSETKVFTAEIRHQPTDTSLREVLHEMGVEGDIDEWGDEEFLGVLLSEPGYRCTFQVAANCEKEAEMYLEELFRNHRYPKFDSVIFAEADTEEELDHRGVYRCSPFSPLACSGDEDRAMDAA